MRAGHPGGPAEISGVDGGGVPVLVEYAVDAHPDLVPGGLPDELAHAFDTGFDFGLGMTRLMSSSVTGVETSEFARMKLVTACLQNPGRPFSWRQHYSNRRPIREVQALRDHSPTGGGIIE